MRPPTTMRAPFCVLGLLLIVPTSGCGDDRDMMETNSGTFTTTTTAGTDTTGATTTEGTTGATTTDDTTTTAGTTEGTTGGNYTCDFSPGCLMPSAPADNVGLASHAPVGCGDGIFTLAAFMFLDDPPYGVGDISTDATKLIPHTTDMNGDGNPDIVINGRKLTGTQIIPGNGDGSFGTPESLSVGGFPNGGWGLDLGDVNNDGAWDIIVGDHSNGPYGWVSSGGSYSQASGLTAESGLSGAGVADLNGDGNLDVILGSDQFGSGYGVLFGSGNGSFSPQSVSGIPAFGAGGGNNIGQFAFDDYDGDGDIDIYAFAISQGFSAVVFENQGDGTSYTQAGTLAGPATNVSGQPIQGAIGDVDCDGVKDVAVGGHIHLRNETGWTMSAAVNQAFLSQLGDMNGDGFLDLVTHSPEGGVQLYLGDGGTSWTETDVGLPGPADIMAPMNYELDDAWGLDLADVDGNGNLDVIRGYKAMDTMGFGTDTERKNYLEVWFR